MMNLFYQLPSHVNNTIFSGKGRAMKGLDEDLLGKRFGGRTIIGGAPTRFTTSTAHRRVMCRCDCGREEDVDLYYLKRGKADTCKRCMIERNRPQTTSGPVGESLSTPAKIAMIFENRALRSNK
jgi:hypothetical protein